MSQHLLEPIMMTPTDMSLIRRLLLAELANMSDEQMKRTGHSCRKLLDQIDTYPAQDH